MMAVLTTFSGTAENIFPYAAHDISLVEACTKKICCNERGNVKLKSNHNQIQNVMRISKTRWCDFVVWTPTGIFIEELNSILPSVNKMKSK